MSLLNSIMGQFQTKAPPPPPCPVPSIPVPIPAPLAASQPSPVDRENHGETRGQTTPATNPVADYANNYATPVAPRPTAPPAPRPPSPGSKTTPADASLVSVWVLTGCEVACVRCLSRWCVETVWSDGAVELRCYCCKAEVDGNLHPEAAAERREAKLKAREDEDAAIGVSG